MPFSEPKANRICSLHSVRIVVLGGLIGYRLTRGWAQRITNAFDLIEARSPRTFAAQK
jgi:hypothetical protein